MGCAASPRLHPSPNLPLIPPYPSPILPPSPPRSLPAAPRISRAPPIALETTRQNTISLSPASLAPFPGRNGEDRLALRHLARYFEAPARARRGQLGRATIPSALSRGVLKRLSRRFKIVPPALPLPNGDNCAIILDAVYGPAA